MRAPAKGVERPGARFKRAARRGRTANGRCKVEGRDQRLVYQPRDSRRLSRVPRDEFIGFIIKRGSRNTTATVTRPVIYTSLALLATRSARDRASLPPLILPFSASSPSPAPLRCYLSSRYACSACKHFSRRITNTDETAKGSSITAEKFNHALRGSRQRNALAVL